MKNYSNSMNSNCYEVLTSKDVKFLRECASSIDEDVRRDVALNENITNKIVSILIKDESVGVRRALAMNEAISTLSLYTLAQDEDEQVRLNAISNHKFPDLYLVMLAKSLREDVKFSVASKRFLPDAVLDVFSKDSNPKLRKVAARGNALYHPSDKFCFDPDEDVRAVFAGNSNASPKALLILSHDKSSKVLISLAHNHVITKEIIHNLALSGNEEVCFIIGKYDMYPETAKLIYEYNSFRINYYLSKNYSTPVEILKELAESTDPTVKSNAEFQLKRLENK